MNRNLLTKFGLCFALRSNLTVTVDYHQMNAAHLILGLSDLRVNWKKKKVVRYVLPCYSRI